MNDAYKKILSQFNEDDSFATECHISMALLSYFKKETGIDPLTEEIPKELPIGMQGVLDFLEMITNAAAEVDRPGVYVRIPGRTFNKMEFPIPLSAIHTQKDS